VNTFVRSSDFDAWLSNLADQKAKARILARIRSATFGNVLLACGVKATQAKDIAKAKKMARELKGAKR
jgi:putative component of toxin-antitoxin plasmid stabilization module